MLERFKKMSTADCEITYYNSGAIRTIIYSKDGKWHHDSLPAVAYYNEDGSIDDIGYFLMVSFIMQMDQLIYYIM